MSWDESNPLHCEIVCYVRQRIKDNYHYKYSRKYGIGGVMSLGEGRRDAILEQHTAQQVIAFVRSRLSKFVTSDTKNLDTICRTILFNEEAVVRSMSLHLMYELSYRHTFDFNPYNSAWGWEDEHKDQLSWESKTKSFKEQILRNKKRNDIDYLLNSPLNEHLL